MLDISFFEITAEALRCLNGDGADQYRLIPLVALLNRVDDGIPFRRFVDVNEVVLVVANDRLVRRYGNDIKLVGLLKLFRLGQSRASHAGEFVVHAEEILEGDGRHRDVFAADLHAFLGFNRLMQAFGEAAPGHEATGEVIDDDDFAILHDIFFIPLKQSLGAQAVIKIRQHLGVIGVIQLGDAERGFNLFHASLGQIDDAVFDIEHVVAIWRIFFDAVFAAFLEALDD